MQDKPGNKIEVNDDDDDDDGGGGWASRPVNSSLCQWLQLCCKELVAGEDGQEILSNSFHKGLKYIKGRVANSQVNF